MNARAQAIANENRQIEESQSRAIAAREIELARPPRNALEALASRLSVDAAGLKRTLLSTAFKGCSAEEFIALVIVSNTYQLNPLLREIYAFPKKGGGIQAIVGYDGWIKIANSHPQFDGLEFVHIEGDNGVVKAIEGILYRKDRSHPTKKMVYLKEFKRNTDPWDNSPNHMLDVRCFCHTVRLGLGVSLGVEGDENLDVDGGFITAQTLPNRQSLAEELNDEIPNFDKETGEIIEEPARDAATGMTEVSEEQARALDAGQTEDHREGKPDADMGEAHNGDPEAERETWSDNVDQIKADLRAARSKDALKRVEQDFLKVCAAWPKAVADEVEALLAARRKEV